MSRTKKSNSKRKNETVVRDNAIVITIAVIAVLLFIGILGIGGKFAEVCRFAMFSVFGLLAYAFPICVIGSILYLYIMKNNKMRIPKVVVFWVFFILLCMFFQLLTGGYDMSSAIVDIVKYSRENHMGGGFVGGILEVVLRPIFGLVGCFIIDSAAMIICLVFLTEISFVDAAIKGGEDVYKASKEKTRAVKNIIAENKADKKMRMDNKRVGVSLDTTVGPSDGAQSATVLRSDDLKELTLNAPLEEDLPTKDDGYFSNTIIEQLNCNKNGVFVTSEPVAEPEPVYIPEPLYEPENSYEIEPQMQTAPEPKVQKAPNQKTLPKDDNSSADEGISISENDKSGKPYKSFPLSLLASPSKKALSNNNTSVKDKLQATLDSFGVDATVTGYEMGPSVTRYEILPNAGVKVSKIVGLSDDIKLALAAADIRIEAPIPGKSVIGIEVPNKENVTVTLRELLESDTFKKQTSKIAFTAGKDIGGNVVIADIAKMPHLLIAGATGSGKSVCINTIIMSILYHASPDEVKMIMIDPKVVELSVYNGIPHLLTNVVTDPKKAAAALNWAVNEMTDRYNKFATTGVRDIFAYNRHVDEITGVPEEEMPAKLPQIVVIVDELADLMMVAPGDVEDAICRLAQLARACGIHLIIATQRPSVNVITGLIKANMPSRIAFSVSSGVDSRTILDMNGAEKLLGKGDMLYYPQGLSKPKRVQGAFVDDKEVANVVSYIKENYVNESESDDVGSAIDEIHASAASSSSNSSADPDNDRDELFVQAAEFIINSDKASIGSLQRKFRIGFNRAARIMDQLSEAEIVGPEEGTKPRQILMGPEQFEQFKEEYL